MTDIHPEMYKRPAECVLKIISGPGTGDVFPIFVNESLVIGKGEDCTVCLDTLSENISYKHARLTPKGNDYLLENLSQANPTTVDNQPIGEKHLSRGGRFQIDNVIFYLDVPVFEKKQRAESAKKDNPGRHRKILLIGLFSLSVFFLLIFLFRGEDTINKTTETSGVAESLNSNPKALSDNARPDNDRRSSNMQKDTISKSTEGGQPPGDELSGIGPDKPAIFASENTPEPNPPAKTITGPQGDVVEENGRDIKNSDTRIGKDSAKEEFRKGMFFYDNNQLKNAVLSWQTALALNPEHRRAATWLERAKSELDQKINNHYRKGLKAKKYMHFNEAANEFRMVLELCINHQDERYLGSQEQLNSFSGQ